MDNQFDDLIYLGWKNGQIKDNSFPFLIRMRQAEIRFILATSPFSSSGKKEKKKGVVPTIPLEFEESRLQRLKEHGLL